MKLSEYERAAEAILFAVGTAVPIESLARAIGIDSESAVTVIENLCSYYDSEMRGIKIIKVEDCYQMCTNPSFYHFVRALTEKEQKKKLSPAVIETLAIIAYKQPVTKTQIEEIRGVDATHAVNRLMESGLVCEKGRLDSPGRPILLGTTEEFLKYFGFSGLDKLPIPIEKTENIQ
ncbi:MAG: SMC-Scp complex subunit ScpB [Oscillospiraceae bacterium]|jgi:segregation and condensation protein B|nr:SMC-Scp complex subunit ScpB [Oscillospiraceae bacterium]